MSEAEPVTSSEPQAVAKIEPRGLVTQVIAKVREYLILIGFAMGLAVLIRLFVGLAFEIPTESMQPTLKPNDRVVVSRLAGDPRRGDIVVFENPGFVPAKETAPRRVARSIGSLVGVGQPRQKFYIKRIIGLPGDTVESKGGKVYINGAVLAEPWLQAGAGDRPFQLERVPAGKYWVLGDNRLNSCDSTCFTDKTGKQAKFIDRSAIVGPAVFRVWPPRRIGRP